MVSKLHREHDAQATMLAFRTGLSASMCEAWIEAPIAKSAEAIKAAFLPASDDNSVIVLGPKSKPTPWRGLRNTAKADHGQGPGAAF